MRLTLLFKSKIAFYVFISVVIATLLLVVVYYDYVAPRQIGLFPYLGVRNCDMGISNSVIDITRGRSYCIITSFKNIHESNISDGNSMGIIKCDEKIEENTTLSFWGSITRLHTCME